MPDSKNYSTFISFKVETSVLCDMGCRPKTAPTRTPAIGKDTGFAGSGAKTMAAQDKKNPHRRRCGFF